MDTNYSGTVREILGLDLGTTARRAIFISSLNAVMAYLGRIPEAIHCKNDDLMKCAEHFHDFIANQPSKMDNILLVGL